MYIVFKEVKIIDQTSPFHNSIQNILIKDGIIDKIGKSNFKADKVFQRKGLMVSKGWFDMRANFNDPGLEFKEDIESGCKTATVGGFTGIAILPNTDPVVQSKSQIEYIKSKSAACLPDIYPIAALTTDTKGEELTEMIDLHYAGASAFSDGELPVWNTDILLKSLIYLQKFDGLLINKPEDRMLTQFGDMNEGPTSTVLGMKGMPALAEELMIKRDLDILEYTGGKIHFSNLSSKGAVAIIRLAKKKKLNVSCDVSIHHLIYDETNLGGYDTNYKSNPPFRTDIDRRSLIKGVSDGTIDAIVSAHSPQDEENKKLEFDKAAFGLLGLQTFWPQLNSLKKDIKLEVLLQKITDAPRHILNLPSSPIQEKEIANLTFFSEKEEWPFNNQTNTSKSTNSPLFNSIQQGKVMAVVNGIKNYIDPTL
ncbi:MAG: dihydroorotase [Cyclobacteriaceae bacterium]|jgi:dihydroorotase|nr:dihydroorotase [Cyclobacteriaceae bacterium]